MLVSVKQAFLSSWITLLYLTDSLNNAYRSFGGECFLGLKEILGAEDLFCDCSMARDTEGGFYGEWVFVGEKSPTLS